MSDDVTEEFNVSSTDGEVNADFFTGSEENADSNREELNGQFSYKQIGSITVCTEPVNGSMSIDSLVDMFTEDPELQAVPIEEYDHVVGVLDRHEVAEATNTTWKRLTSKDISSYVKHVHTILYAADFIEKALQKVSDINHKYGTTYFPVYNGRMFFGIVSLDAFLARIADIREKDLDKASSIQTYTFPKPADLAQFQPKIIAWNRMANTLGGDIYQTYRMNDHESLICCFDVSGKNVAASLLTMTVASFFKMLPLMPQQPKTPIGIISLLDTYLETIVPSGNFITGAVCYFDTERNIFSIFNCGHTTVYMIYSEGSAAPKTVSVDPKLPPFGMGVIESEFKKNQDKKDRPYLALEIKAGIHIDMYSDGFTDMQNTNSVRYEDANAKQFFTDLYNVDDDKVEQKITKTIDEYTEDTMLPDDITVIDIRF